MKKRTGFMLALNFLLLGIIIGFLAGPIRKGIGNNNGNSNVYNYNNTPKDENTGSAV